MQVKTILNGVERHRGFVVYEAVRFSGSDRKALEVEVRERAGSRPICSECGRCGPWEKMVSVHICLAFFVERR